MGKIKNWFDENMWASYVFFMSGLMAYIVVFMGVLDLISVKSENLSILLTLVPIFPLLTVASSGGHGRERQKTMVSVAEWIIKNKTILLLLYLLTLSFSIDFKYTGWIQLFTIVINLFWIVTKAYKLRGHIFEAIKESLIWEYRPVFIIITLVIISKIV